MAYVSPMCFAALVLCVRVWSTGRLCIGYHGKRRNRTRRICWGMRTVMEDVGLWLWRVGFNVRHFSNISPCTSSRSRVCADVVILGVLAAIHRTRIRKLYRIEGNFGSDCLTSCCCCCCVLIQNEREVRDREQSIRQHAGPASVAYVAPGTMTYAPPPR